jgi:hypothetical protein
VLSVAKSLSKFINNTSLQNKTFFLRIFYGQVEILRILLVVRITFQKSSYRRMNTKCVHGISAFPTLFLNAARFPSDGLRVQLVLKLNCYRYAVILPLSSFLKRQ